MERGNFGTYNEFDGIGELKLDIGPGYRVYYGKYGDVIVILLGGGDKKSQQSDIEVAKRRWLAWKKEGASTDDLRAWSDDAEESEENNDGETVSGDAT